MSELKDNSLAQSPTFCPHPWTSLTTSPSGQVRICCMGDRDLLDSDGKPWVLDKSTMKDIWNSDDLKKIRADLKSGVKNSYCKLCWAEEAGHRDSQRMRDLQLLSKVFDFNTLEEEIAQPRVLVLKLGNTCNIRCRTCGSHSSSKWIKEEYDTDEEIQKRGSFQDYQNSFKSYVDSYKDESALWENFEEWLPKVKQINMYGGEPFLVSKQWDVLEKSIERGFSKDQVVHFNTNGTLWPDAKIEMLKHFKNVNVSFSIDGVGPRLEYIRDLAKWDVVTLNLKKAQEFGRVNPTFEFNVCITISNFNIYYLDEVINHFEKINVYCYLNLVHWPKSQCITNLPSHIKDIVASKVRGNVPQTSHVSSSLDHILNFMFTQKDEEILFNEFKQKLAIHDKYRNQDFKKVNPEFAEVLGI